MSWSLSRFRAGETVEVLGKDEILATLDKNGCLDGMPFMPEMLQYCGRRFQVVAVAHKTCDTARQTWTGRRLQSAVHLAGLRCDGAAHGGCQAECLLFWKDEWLKLAGKSGQDSTSARTSAGAVCTEALLHAKTRTPPPTPGEEPRYACQATNLWDFSQPLAWWDPRQHIYDVLTRNHPPGRVLRVVWLAALRWLQPRMPLGYRLFTSFHDWMHRWLTGLPSPSLNGAIPIGEPTPSGRLNLKIGERVRIKSQLEIEKTLDKKGNNRGLSFDPNEMAPYCGQVFTVRKSVTKLIDEPTGKMLHMKQPCVMLNGVVCNGENSPCRLNCPRAIPSFWRELWLERVELPQKNTSDDVPRVAAGAV